MNLLLFFFVCFVCFSAIGCIVIESKAETRDLLAGNLAFVFCGAGSIGIWELILPGEGWIFGFVWTVLFAGIFTFFWCITVVAQRPNSTYEEWRESLVAPTLSQDRRQLSFDEMSALSDEELLAMDEESRVFSGIPNKGVHGHLRN